MSDEISEAPPLTEWDGVSAYVPRTPLGKRLWEIRSQILASDPGLGYETSELGSDRKGSFRTAQRS